MAIPKINSIAAAEQVIPHQGAVEFQSTFDGTERIGWTYETPQGNYSWINGDGSTSQRPHGDRETARNDAINTHRSKP